MAKLITESLKYDSEVHILKRTSIFLGLLSVDLWWIHFDIWQNQYNIVKFKNKIIKKKEVYTNKQNSILLA